MQKMTDWATKLSTKDISAKLYAKSKGLSYIPVSDIKVGTLMSSAKIINRNLLKGKIYNKVAKFLYT